MKAHNLLLARIYTERPEQTHEGKVVTMRPNIRRCSDGFEFTCWKRDVMRRAKYISSIILEETHSDHGAARGISDRIGACLPVGA